MKIGVVVIFVLAVILGGVGQGQWTGRWQNLTSLEQYVNRLDSIPMTVGSWNGTDILMPDADALPRAGIAGYKYRQYINELTREVVTVLIVCGRPGPISVHTPDVCYSGMGYNAQGEPQILAINDVSLWRLKFRSPTAQFSNNELEVRWAWVSAGKVEASDMPRIRYRNNSALYKLYVIRQSGRTANDASVEHSNQHSLDFESVYAPQIVGALVDG